MRSLPAVNHHAGNQIKRPIRPATSAATFTTRATRNITVTNVRDGLTEIRWFPVGARAADSRHRHTATD